MLAVPSTVLEGATRVAGYGRLRAPSRSAVNIFDQHGKPMDKELEMCQVWSCSTRAPSKPHPDLEEEEEESPEEEAFDPEAEFEEFIRAREAQEVAKPRRLHRVSSLTKSEVCDVSWRPIAADVRASKERQAVPSHGDIAKEGKPQ